MNKVWCLLVCSSVMAVAALSQSPSAQSGLLFETSFNCPDWNQSMGLNDGNVCASGDGISGHGGWTSSAGHSDQLTAAANYGAGGGGKGLRHWRGNGSNNGGGGLSIRLPRSVTEMWVRFYMRFQAGFAWSNPGSPLYTKDNYWGACGSGCIVFGIQGGGWGIGYNGAVNHPSSLSWSASQGGPTGDGQWHSYEYHVRQNGSAGVIEFWFDGVRYMSKSADLGSNPWSGFSLGENQSSVAGCPNDCYTDYDDLAISTTGYIGPIGGLSSGGGGGGLPAAPVNLRIVP